MSVLCLEHASLFACKNVACWITWIACHVLHFVWSRCYWSVARLNILFYKHVLIINIVGILLTWHQTKNNQSLYLSKTIYFFTYIWCLKWCASSNGLSPFTLKLWVQIPLIARCSYYNPTWTRFFLATCGMSVTRFRQSKKLTCNIQLKILLNKSSDK